MVRPLALLVERIPATLANAMLAGVLLPLCLAPVRAVAEQPVAGLAIVVTWAVVARINRVLAVPAAVVVAVGVIAASAPLPATGWLPQPEFVMPCFSAAAVTGIALPLFIVTMASQNIPGLAVLSATVLAAWATESFWRLRPGLAGGGTGWPDLAAVVTAAAIWIAAFLLARAYPEPARHILQRTADG